MNKKQREQRVRAVTLALLGDLVRVKAAVKSTFWAKATAGQPGTVSEIKPEQRHWSKTAQQYYGNGPAIRVAFDRGDMSWFGVHHLEPLLEE